MSFDHAYNIYLCLPYLIVYLVMHLWPLFLLRVLQRSPWLFFDTVLLLLLLWLWLLWITVEGNRRIASALPSWQAESNVARTAPGSNRSPEVREAGTSSSCHYQLWLGTFWLIRRTRESEGNGAGYGYGLGHGYGYGYGYGDGQGAIAWYKQFS